MLIVALVLAIILVFLIYLVVRFFIRDERLMNKNESHKSSPHKSNKHSIKHLHSHNNRLRHASNMLSWGRGGDDKSAKFPSNNNTEQKLIHSMDASMTYIPDDECLGGVVTDLDLARMANMPSIVSSHFIAPSRDSSHHHQKQQTNGGSQMMNPFTNEHSVNSNGFHKNSIYMSPHSFLPNQNSTNQQQTQTEPRHDLDLISFSKNGHAKSSSETNDSK